MPIRMVLAIIFLVVSVPLLVIGKHTFDPGAHYEKTVDFRKWGLIPAGLFVLFTLLSCVRVVDTGHVGIPVTFGEAGAPLNAGVAFTNPFATVREMSVRTEDYTMTLDGNGDDSIDVQGSDGATGVADATILYRLGQSEASTVFRSIGTGYEDRIVRPLARTCIRDAFVEYTMLEGATTYRSNASADINACLRSGLEPRGLILESFQLRGVSVSERVQEAIDNRVAAAEAAERAEFDLQRTVVEGEQRRVEAQAIADAEQIIVCGSRTVTADDGTESVVPKEGGDCERNLTPEYLTLQYIQAMESLIESGNTATLVMPFDQSLTPLLNMGGAG